jgi:uncharacterized alpha-E superfamily protein
VIARVADHCFWLGRYIERAESTARVLQVTGVLALDAELPAERCWLPVVIVAGQEADFVARFGREAFADPAVVQHYLVSDEDNPVSLRRTVAAARENARSIRDVVSLEVWQVINELQIFLRSDEAEALVAQDLDAFYVRVQRATQLGLGLMRSTMLHDAPLDYIWLGVLLERISQTARLLDVQHHALVAHLSTAAPHPVLETALWLSLLRACSGFEAFVKRNRGKVDGGAVAAFLVLEARFPRSVLYCVHSARDRLAAICEGVATTYGGGGGPPPTHGTTALTHIEALEGWLAVLSPAELHGAHVHEALTRVVDEVHAVCDVVGRELLCQNDLPLESLAQSQ